MPSDKPWLDGPTPQDHAKARVWQGAMVFVMGATFTAITYFGFGLIWMWPVFAAVGGLFWMLVGLVTLLTGYE
jgi:fatty acid desaturase